MNGVKVLIRLAFHSVATLLQKHLIESADMTQIVFISTLFSCFVNDCDFSFDEGLCCKWMKGQAKISPTFADSVAKNVILGFHHGKSVFDTDYYRLCCKIIIFVHILYLPFCPTGVLFCRYKI